LHISGAARHAFDVAARIMCRMVEIYVATDIEADGPSPGHLFDAQLCLSRVYSGAFPAGFDRRRENLNSPEETPKLAQLYF
jgi:hypothetical protein